MADTSPESLIIPSRRYFYYTVSSFLDVLGSSAPAGRSALLEALATLKSYSWDGSLPLELYGVAGDSYAYEFYPGYVLTFRRETVRDHRKQPVQIKLFLRAVQRKSRRGTRG